MPAPKGNKNAVGNKAKTGMGKKVDVKVLRGLGEIQCTWAEIGACFQCDESVIRKNIEYNQIVKEAREAGKKSLRRMQFALAKKSPAMCIWLGKQYLGQREPDPELKEYAKSAFDKYLEEQRKEKKKNVK